MKRLRLALPAASGALIAAAFLDFRWWPVAWVSFLPLLWSLHGPPTRRDAARLGLTAGLAANVPAFHWLVHTMTVFGGFPIFVSAFFYACLSLYSACQFALFALALRYTGAGPLAILPAVLWVALEFLYPNLFPWRMANTQFEASVLTQIGDVTGPFGLSFVIVWIQSALVATLRERRRWPALAAAAAALGAVAAYGAWRIPIVRAAIDAAPVVRVGLVQGNIGIVEKRDVAYFDINLERYRQLSAPLEQDVDLLIWPETVSQEWVPTDLATLPDDANPYPGLRIPLIYGGLAYTPLGERRHAKFNSAFLIDPAGRVLGRYDKHVLLPFGEYLPGASLIPALARLSPQTGDFTPGNRIVTLDVPGAARSGAGSREAGADGRSGEPLVRIAPLVCYEDVPARIARAMTLAGAEALLTMFNDAWFGRSVAPYQHEALALWRAIENRRYFLRVGNAGVTGVVDPFGNVVAHLGLFTEETLTAEIRPLRIRSVYTRIGDVFGWGVTLAGLAALAAARLSRGSRTN